MIIWSNTGTNDLGFSTTDEWTLKGQLFLGQQDTLVQDIKSLYCESYFSPISFLWTSACSWTKLLSFHRWCWSRMRNVFPFACAFPFSSFFGCLSQNIDYCLGKCFPILPLTFQTLIMLTVNCSLDKEPWPFPFFTSSSFFGRISLNNDYCLGKVFCSWTKIYYIGTFCFLASFITF